jgi:class 3 adenylate cyclase/ABC-type transport system involved in cytochrome c biogenesis ATPase subunit/tetratricopeptide (TPR) repeat protein
MTPVVKCPSCSTLLVSGARFCVACGARASIYCPACGASNAATAHFCDQCGAAFGSAVATPVAERRHITFLFCDLVGSTALAADLDPEDTRRVLLSYQDACAAIIPIYDAFLARFVGDGIFVYFGYPRAHEDDAERAVRAGLDMVAAVGKVRTPTGVPLTVRIGIATGTVVVDRLVGKSVAHEQAVFGAAPNMAERIKSLANPGTVVIAPSTRRLLGDLFQLHHLGQHELKGYVEPVEAWEVMQVAPSESRFDAVRADRLTEFVGRERETNLLLDRKRLAWQGDGQVVLVSGEAGIGKSRLVAWLAGRLSAESHIKLRYQCSPYHSHSALYPFISQLSYAAGFRPDDSPTLRLRKLEKLLLRGTTDVQSAVPLIATLLSIPLQECYPPLQLSAAQQRRQTFAALLDQAAGLARKLPLLIIFEDLHWADATSLELLDLAVKRVNRAPVLLILTFRPDFDPPWANLDGTSSLTLGRLDSEDARIIVARTVGNQRLPEPVVEQIVGKADGVPLFIEELTKTVLESRPPADAKGHFQLEPLTIPESLHDSLMARLDRLAPVKEVAQMGATIGRQFSYTLLRAVALIDDATLNSALMQLETSGLLFRRGTPPEASYSFKHALVQDTAYESVLKSRRHVLHRRIAEVLRDRFAGIAQKEPELIAHHFTQAGLLAPAIEWWDKAGERALHHAAYVEAIVHFGSALSLAERMPESPQQRSLRLRLQLAQGQALIAARGYGAPEATAAFERARELASGVEETAERLAAYHALWASSWIRCDLPTMREMADIFFLEVQRQPGRPEIGIAHRLCGATCCFVGDCAAAKAHLEQAAAIYDRHRDGHLAYRFGHDVGVVAECYLALALWALGEVGRAQRIAEAAFAHALESRHLPTAAFGHAYMCIFEAVRRDAARAAPYADALVGYGREHGMQWWLVAGTMFRGWTRWHAGKRSEGLAEMQQGMTLCQEYGLSSAPSLFETLLAEVEAEDSKFEAARARLDRLYANIQRTGERWIEPEVLRQRGNLMLKCKPADLREAECAFQRAMDVARGQNARTFELRAALQLAQLYHIVGRHTAAREVLTPLLLSFKAEPDLPEVKRAELLLLSTAAS